MSSQDPLLASFSYKSPDCNGSMRAYCVECMNRSYASYLSHFYSNKPDEGGIPIFLHTTGGDKEYKINELLYLNGSQRPFLFRKIPDNIVLLVRDCGYRCREAVTTLVSAVPASISVTPAPVWEASQTAGFVSDVADSTDLPDTPEASVPFTPPITSRVGKGGKQFPLCSATASLGGTPLNKQQFFLQRKIVAALFDSVDFSQFDKIFFTKWSLEMEPYVCCGIFIRSPTSMLQHVIKDKGHAINLFQSRTATLEDTHDLLDRIKEAAKPLPSLKKYTSCWNISSTIDEAGERVREPYHFPFLNGFDENDCTDAMSGDELEFALAPRRLFLTSSLSIISKLLSHHNASNVCQYCEKKFPGAGHCLQHTVSRVHLEKVQFGGAVFSRSRDFAALQKVLGEAQEMRQVSTSNPNEVAVSSRTAPAEKLSPVDPDRNKKNGVTETWLQYMGPDARLFYAEFSLHLPFLDGYSKDDCTDIMTSEELECALPSVRQLVMKLTSNISKLLYSTVSFPRNCQYCEKMFLAAGNCLQHTISKRHLETAHSVGVVFSRSKDFEAFEKLVEDAANLNNTCHPAPKTVGATALTCDSIGKKQFASDGPEVI